MKCLIGIIEQALISDRHIAFFSQAVGVYEGRRRLASKRNLSLLLHMGQKQKKSGWTRLKGMTKQCKGDRFALQGKGMVLQILVWEVGQEVQ